MSIRLGDDFTITSKGVATQTFGILAVRGAGKSNLAAVMAEEMHRLRLPFVVVDPVGSWWGLRSSADGKSPGLDVPIFGGRRGDVPLEKTGGQVLADLVVDDRVSCVLDVSEFSEGEKIHFLIDFAERLYRRNTEPLHLFLEEADDYCPQRPMREQARLLRAWENIVRRGRARGLGISMITQRSAALNKNVLTQIETLFVLRTTSPQDRKAIEGWIEYHGERREVLESLSGLQAGEAWIWSPSWLKVMKRIQVSRRSTFDSAATPKEVRGARPAATLADVDLAKVRARMTASIERAKQEDPRELRHRIAELEKLAAGALEANVQTKRVEILTIPKGGIQRLESLAARIEAAAPIAASIRETIAAALQQSRELRVEPVGAIRKFVALKPWAQPSPRSPRRASGNGRDAAVGGGERKILIAIAQHVGGVTREQLTVLTGYRRSSRDTYLQRLHGSGLVTRPIGEDRYLATEAGMAELGSGFERLPTGAALLEHWLNRLAGGERAILAEVARSYPKSVDRNGLSEVIGLKRSSRDTYLQRLRARRLIVPDGACVRLSQELAD